MLVEDGATKMFVDEVIGELNLRWTCIQHNCKYYIVVDWSHWTDADAPLHPMYINQPNDVEQDPIIEL